MGWTSRRCLWMGLVLSANGLNGAEPGFRVTVRLYDYAAVSETVLAKAEQEATRIYRQAGVELRWEECKAEHVENACGTEPAALRLGILSLSILTPTMESGLRKSANLPQKNMVSGVAVGERAYVFIQRLVEICAEGKYPEAVILGHLMAHEVGHILLGENSHSPDGLMSGRLSPADLRLALDNLLFFNAKQSAKMRERLAGQLTAGVR